MTLLEALVALVILGLASLGFLGAFHGASHATRDAAVWVQAVGQAEAAMEQTKLGTVQDVVAGALPGDFQQDVTVEPWSPTTGVERVTVTVRLPDGGSFELQRLVAPR